MNLLISLLEMPKRCLRHRILTSPARQEQYLVRLRHDRVERGVPSARIVSRNKELGHFRQGTATLEMAKMQLGNDCP
jgi:hypothetical protein